ncbi:unnamed protein product [Ixodes pacificus]
MIHPVHSVTRVSFPTASHTQPSIEPPTTTVEQATSMPDNLVELMQQTHLRNQRRVIVGAVLTACPCRSSLRSSSWPSTSRRRCHLCHPRGLMWHLWWHLRYLQQLKNMCL